MNYIYYELNEYSSISNTIKISDKTKFNSNLIVYVLVIYLFCYQENLVRIGLFNDIKKLNSFKI